MSWPFYAPAFWRAFFVFILLSSGGSSLLQAQRQYRPLPGYVQLRKPDQEEGRRILDEFRQSGGLGIPGEYFLEFQLRVLPRRGKERVHVGRMWGAPNEQGVVSRVSLQTGTAEQRLLIQSGREPHAWSWREGGAGVERLGVSALFTPLAETDVTPFDLQMPFLYWTEFVFEGVARVRGRPAHQFLLYPPEEFAAKYPALTGVRVYLDTQFRALVQSELIGDGGRLTKSVTLLDLKKVGDQWIPKSFDLRDEATRNKTRFLVTGAALAPNLRKGIFAPTALAEDVPLPPPDRITRIEP